MNGDHSFLVPRLRVPVLSFHRLLNSRVKVRSTGSELLGPTVVVGSVFEGVLLLACGGGLIRMLYQCWTVEAFVAKVKRSDSRSVVWKSKHTRSCFMQCKRFGV